jgi:hypothetical protein
MRTILPAACLSTTNSAEAVHQRLVASTRSARRAARTGSETDGLNNDEETRRPRARGAAANDRPIAIGLKTCRAASGSTDLGGDDAPVPVVDASTRATFPPAKPPAHGT